MVDQAKRKTLKTVAYSGLGAAALSAGSAMAAPVSALLTNVSPTDVPSAGLSITHYDNFHGHTVLLRNTTDRALSLQNIYPGRVKTPSGDLDLQKLVARGELTIPANTTQAISISDQGDVHRYARWTHINGDVTAYDPSKASQFVNVNGRYGAGLPSISTALHIAAIA